MCDFGSLSAGGGFQIRLQSRMTARKMETKNERRMSGLWNDVTIVPGSISIYNQPHLCGT